MRIRVLALVAALALGGCASGSGTTEVSMTDDQRFDPNDLSVAAGTTLTFTNDSDEPHTVTAEQGSVPDAAAYFSSGGFSNEKQARADVGTALIRSGETYELTLDEPGSYRYACIPHEANGMVGRIEVTR